MFLDVLFFFTSQLYSGKIRRNGGPTPTWAAKAGLASFGLGEKKSNYGREERNEKDFKNHFRGHQVLQRRMRLCEKLKGPSGDNSLPTARRGSGFKPDPGRL